MIHDCNSSVFICVQHSVVSKNKLVLQILFHKCIKVKTTVFRTEDTISTSCELKKAGWI